jgi:hypothetical protein
VRGSNGCDRERGRRRARHNERPGECIHAYNTLSVENTSVQVFYPFHPFNGVILQVIRRPKRGHGAVSVIDPTGRRLKIPVWMLSSDCAEIKTTERPHLSKEAVLSLASALRRISSRARDIGRAQTKSREHSADSHDDVRSRIVTAKIPDRTRTERIALRFSLGEENAVFLTS